MEEQQLKNEMEYEKRKKEEENQYQRDKQRRERQQLYDNYNKIEEENLRNNYKKNMI
jgi:hypothetical protein